ncbi:MAG: hypothetical protein L0Y58_18365, partial [Verrucomicrobia subdivision 3 bacterium]|nr:hypothetical protein [Limisphaerales bacterium]
SRWRRACKSILSDRGLARDGGTPVKRFIQTQLIIFHVTGAGRRCAFSRIISWRVALFGWEMDGFWMGFGGRSRWNPQAGDAIAT